MIAFHQIFEVKTENLNQPTVATNNNNQHKVDIGSARGASPHLEGLSGFHP
jgi:hypothetical protein